MKWKDVRCGDTVTVKHRDGAEIVGEVHMINGLTAGIGGVYVSIDEATIKEHKRSYKDGDIAVYASPYTGTWVGIYDAKDRMFYDNSEEENRTGLFDVSGEGITVIGNVKNFVK